MKFAKSFLMGTGALVLAGLVLTLAAPKAAHAIAATAVLVENTVSSPVPTQAILPGAPFSQSCYAGSASGCYMLPLVPSGFTFHATQQNLETTLNSNVTAAPTATWRYTTSGQNLAVVENVSGPVPGSTFIALANHDWYVDAGTQVGCGTNLPDYTTFFVQCTVTGYLTH
jgi:hypothetical protein